jgi:hypothetical protein
MGGLCECCGRKEEPFISGQERRIADDVRRWSWMSLQQFVEDVKSIGQIVKPSPASVRDAYFPFRKLNGQDAGLMRRKIPRNGMFKGHDIAAEPAETIVATNGSLEYLMVVGNN